MLVKVFKNNQELKIQILENQIAEIDAKSGRLQIQRQKVLSKIQRIKDDIFRRESVTNKAAAFRQQVNQKKNVQDSEEIPSQTNTPK